MVVFTMNIWLKWCLPDFFTMKLLFSPLMEKCLVGDILRLCEYCITFQTLIHYFYDFFSKWRFSNSVILSTISVRFFSTMKRFLFSVLSVCEFYLCIYLCIYVFVCVSMFLQFNATFKNNLIESNADLKRDMIKIQ